MTKFVVLSTSNNSILTDHNDDTRVFDSLETAQACATEINQARARASDPSTWFGPCVVLAWRRAQLQRDAAAYLDAFRTFLASVQENGLREDRDDIRDMDWQSIAALTNLAKQIVEAVTQ